MTAIPTDSLPTIATSPPTTRTLPWSGRVGLSIGLAMLAAIAILCIFAPLFTQYGPTSIDAANPLAPLFSKDHILGTDQYGRDLWSRILYGGRYDLAIAFGATTVTLLVGTSVGVIGGFLGGKADVIAMRTVDLFFAFPFIVLVIAIIAALGSSLTNIFIALWAVGWVSYARIAHGQTLSANRYGYVIAARALGFSRTRIVCRHILPSVIPGVVVFAMIDAVGNVLLAASLGFLGLGIPQPTPEWGSMISNGQNYLFTNWYVAIMPGLALLWLGISLSLIGDGLSDRLRGSK